MNLYKESSLTFLTQVFSLIIGIITSIIIARILGPLGKGQYTLLTLVPLLMMKFGNLGIGSSNIYLTSKQKYRDEEMISNSLIITLGMSIFLFALFYFGLLFVYPIFLKEVNRGYLYLAMLTLPAGLISMYFSYILVGKREILKYNLIQIINVVLGLMLVVLLLIILNLKVLGALIMFILGSFLSCLVTIFFVSKVSKFVITFNSNLLKESLGFGIKGHLGTFAAFLNYRLDMFLVSMFLGSLYVGYYSIGVGIAEMLWSLGNSVAMVLLPRTSSLESDESGELTATVCRHTLFLTLGGAVLLFVISKPLVEVFFGTSFLPAVLPLQILLPGVVLLSGDKVLSTYIVGQGKPLIPTFVALVGLVVNILLNLIFIPKWGIAGAALASTISYSVDFSITIMFFIKMSRNNLPDFLIIRREDLSHYSALPFQALNRLKALLISI